MYPYTGRQCSSHFLLKYCVVLQDLFTKARLELSGYLAERLDYGTVVGKEHWYAHTIENLVKRSVGM